MKNKKREEIRHLSVYPEHLYGGHLSRVLSWGSYRGEVTQQSLYVSRAAEKHIRDFISECIKNSIPYWVTIYDSNGTALILTNVDRTAYYER